MSVRHLSCCLLAQASKTKSFYEVEYEETQPWLIIEAKRERYSASAKDTITPMLRLIHKRYFVEVGRNRDGAMLNFVLNF